MEQGGQQSGGDGTESPGTPQLLQAILGAMTGLACLGFLSSMFDPKNKVLISLAFYFPLLATLIGLGVVVRRGYVKAPAWILSLFLWCVIAFVTLFFGGLHGTNASIFALSIVLAGTLIGGRAAIAFTVASALWAWLLVALELGDAMPPPLGEYSAINSATAVTTTLVMVSLLVNWSLAALRELNERASASARERDEALRRSIHAQKLQLVGGLTSGIAHDFNNLLTVIASAAETLRYRTAAADHDTHEVLDDLDAATLRATLMTRQLLSFSRAKDGEVGPVDVSSVILALEPMLPRLLGPGVRIRVNTAPEAVALATRAGLEQVLLNLAVNARDAMPSGGVLAIDVEVDDGHVTLRVADNGAGMEDAVRHRIFDTFFTTKTTGTGLGLATVREVVARYGASIDVQSRVGVGTTFELRLLRQKTRGDRATPAPTPRRDPKRARVMLVEDDSLVRRSLERVLESAGFEVVSVGDGLEALAALARAGDVSVVVSDISMPELDGEALAQRLAQLYPALPVVLVSGNRAPGADTLASKRRAFVAKPASAAALLAAIEAVRAP